jgi:uncharacterized protein
MRSVTIEMHGARYAAEVADSASTRSKGLLGRRSLSPTAAMLIQPSNSVHTMFMRFSIDVVYLDGRDIVIKVVRRMKPYRFSWGGFRAKSVIELASGAAPADLAPGSKVRIEPALQ